MILRLWSSLVVFSIISLTGLAGGCSKPSKSENKGDYELEASALLHEVVRSNVGMVIHYGGTAKCYCV